MAPPRTFKYATLVSADGHEYVVPIEATRISPVLYRAVGGGFSEGNSKRFECPTIRCVLPPSSKHKQPSRSYSTYCTPHLHCRVSMMKQATSLCVLVDTDRASRPRGGSA